MSEASEQVQECLSKADVHEAVRDRIAAWRRVRQQLEEADCGVAEILVDGFRIEQCNRVYHVERRPTYEEFNDNHE